MAFCTNCGHALPEGARFCPACGKPMDAPPPVPSPASRSAIPVPPAWIAPPEIQEQAYSASTDTSGESRHALPMPPRLHWGWVYLFTALSGGIFWCVWSFIQAGYVKKLDSKSRATIWLAIGIPLLAMAEIIRIVVEIVVGYHMVDSRPGATLAILLFSVLLAVAGAIFIMCAFFSMAETLERELPRFGVPLSIGRITLFIFNVFYLQGQLTWLARWKETGQTKPPPPKSVFWWIVGIIGGLTLLFIVALAIAVPAHQSYAAQRIEAVGKVGDANEESSSDGVSELTEVESFDTKDVEEIPRFRDYPSGPLYNGLSAPLADKNDEFRTRNSAALAENPVVFASEYVISTIGCGAGCVFQSFLSKRTGEQLRDGFGGENGEKIKAVKPDSLLVVTAGKNDIDNNDPKFYAYFYVLRNGGFERILKRETVLPECEGSDGYCVVESPY